MLDARDVVAHRTDADRVRAGRVDGEHAADGGHRGIGRIGGEIPAALAKQVIQPVANQAGLHTDCVVTNPLNAAHEP